MMWKQQIQNAKRWAEIFLKELDTLHDISPGAIPNLRAVRSPNYWMKNDAPEELLRIIDAARWEDGLTLWHFEGASPASEVTKFWKGNRAELEVLLSRSSQASEFESLKHLHPNLHVGRLLGSLAECFPQRVAHHRTNDARFWIIRSQQI
jgi:hypothetical protein